MANVTLWGAAALGSPAGYLIWSLFFTSMFGLIALAQIGKVFRGLTLGEIKIKEKWIYRTSSPVSFWLTVSISTVTAVLFVPISIALGYSYVSDYLKQGGFPPSPPSITNASVRGSHLSPSRPRS